MAWCRAVGGLLLPVAWALAAFAPQTSFAQNTGTIEGHVYGADTNAPLRTGGVRLRTVSATKAGAGHVGRGEYAPLHLDGSYSFSRVKPGRYYLDASSPGYLDPSDEESTAVAGSGGEPADPNTKLMEVGPNQTVQANFELQRGAAVEGQVLFDDGSPVVLARVKCLRKDANGAWRQIRTGTLPALTDDRGEYRVTGLPAGEYLIQIVKQTHARRFVFSATAVYSGSVFDQKKATPFQLTRGEELTGEDITFPISEMHRVSGMVLAQGDGHPIPEGKVELETADGRALQTVDLDDMGGNGTFRFDGVAERQYTLKVSAARDVDEQDRTTREYGPAEQPLDVENDTTGVVITVPAAK